MARSLAAWARRGSLAVLSIALAGCAAAPATIDVPDELRATLEAAHVGVPPGVFAAGAAGANWSDIAGGKIRPRRAAKLPAIVYAHGCAGWRSGRRLRDIATKRGFAFVAPDSFARTARRGRACCGGGCVPYGYRSEEIEYALREVRKLPWIDGARIVLAGQSEGGELATMYSGRDIGVAGFIISGANCSNSSGWVGLASTVPTLILSGGDDGLETLRGDCVVPRTTPESRMVVLPGVGHQTFHSEAAEREIERFLTSLKLHEAR